MNKTNKILLSVLIFLIVLLLSSVKPVAYEQHVEERVNEKISAKRVDPKTKILAAYLAKHNSPLQFHAQDFIEASNTYDLDWRLVTAISGVESTFGKVIPGGYNGWGWGIYGSNRLYFKSWRDGIFTVSKGLREKYVDKGLTTPYTMNRIYAASPAWGWKVTFFMDDIQNFAKTYEVENADYNVTLAPSNVAVSSALVAFK